MKEKMILASMMLSLVATISTLMAGSACAAPWAIFRYDNGDLTFSGISMAPALSAKRVSYDLVDGRPFVRSGKYSVICNDKWEYCDTRLHGERRSLFDIPKGKLDEGVKDYFGPFATRDSGTSSAIKVVGFLFNNGKGANDVYDIELNEDKMKDAIEKAQSKLGFSRENLADSYRYLTEDARCPVPPVYKRV